MKNETIKIRNTRFKLNTLHIVSDRNGEVPEEIQQERLERFMHLQAQISADKLQKKIGQTMTVLVDSYGEEGLVLARSKADAPEIDGEVILDGFEDVQLGDFVSFYLAMANQVDPSPVRVIFISPREYTSDASSIDRKRSPSTVPSPSMSHTSPACSARPSKLKSE